MKVVLDAGALIGLDRGDRNVVGLLALARRSGATLVTSAPVLGQAWRNGARQAVLSRHLPMIDVRVCSAGEAKLAGELLAANKSGDVVDALVALLVGPNDQVLTSDPDDIASLLRTRKVAAGVISV